jgi:hypothetical protein
VADSTPLLIEKKPPQCRAEVPTPGSSASWKLNSHPRRRFSFLFAQSAIRKAPFFLSAEEGAIVRQMSNQNAEVKSFFTGYETANAIFDIEEIAACYADVFMFGGPEGIQCVKKEDFLKVLPRRKEFFRSRGLVSSNIASLEASTLDSRYTLVKVIWNMRFDRGASEPILCQNAASYILSRTDGRSQIVFQIDHQDLGKRVQELGLE